MKERFAKLIDVKSIVTIMLAVVFAVLAFRGVISGDQFLTVFTVIIAFYFGTQHQKASQSVQEQPQADEVAAIGFDTEGE